MSSFKTAAAGLVGALTLFGAGVANAQTATSAQAVSQTENTHAKARVEFDVTPRTPNHIKVPAGATRVYVHDNYKVVVDVAAKSGTDANDGKNQANSGADITITKVPAVGKDEQSADGTHVVRYFSGLTTAAFNVHVHNAADANAGPTPPPLAMEGAAPPPPPPAPPGPVSGLGYLVLPNAPLNLGVVGLSDKQKALVSESACHAKFGTPLNTQCVENSASSTVQMVLTPGVNSNGEIVFVATSANSAVVTQSVESRGTIGQGWLTPVSGTIVSVGSLVIQANQLHLAQIAQKATQNFYNNINNGITNGTIKDVFGSMFAGGCADTNVVGNASSGTNTTTTGNVSAVCVVNSPSNGSGFGVGNTTTQTGTTSTNNGTITGGVSMLQNSNGTQFGNVRTFDSPSVPASKTQAPQVTVYAYG